MKPKISDNLIKKKMFKGLQQSLNKKEQRKDQQILFLTRNMQSKAAMRYHWWISIRMAEIWSARVAQSVK